MLAGSSGLGADPETFKMAAMLSTMAAEQINVTWAPAATAAPMAAIPRLPRAAGRSRRAGHAAQPQCANYVIELVGDL
jgi:hypothetical protein